MRILITGSSGFIGTNLMEYFLKRGEEVLGLDIKNPKITSHTLYFKKINIMDFDSLKSQFLLFRPNVVIHLAAKTDLDGCDLASYEVNTLGTKNVLFSVRSSLEIKKLIVASSMLVNKVGYKPNSDVDCNPNSFYGESKVITEKITRELAPEYLHWVIIRPTSIWGPWFSAPYRNFFDLVMNGKYYKFNRPSSTKTFGYIGNVIYQIDRLLASLDSKISGHIFYLGDSPAISIDVWANKISVEAKSGDVRELPYIIFYFAAKFGDLLKLFGVKFPLNSYRLVNMKTNNVIDLSKTCKLCGSPPYSVEDGIKNTVTWIYSQKK